MKKIKQSVACEKAIRMSVYVTSIYLSEKKMNKDEAIDYLSERMKEISKKYGFRFSMSILKTVLDTVEHRKSLKVNISGKERNIDLFYGTLKQIYEEYVGKSLLDKLCEEYPDGIKA